MIDAVVWAFDQRCPSPIAKLLLIKLCDGAGYDGECWPQGASVTRDCGLSPTEVEQYLNELIGAGLIAAVSDEDGIRYILAFGRKAS